MISHLLPLLLGLAQGQSPVDLLPSPIELGTRGLPFVLPDDLRVVPSDPALEDLAVVLADYMGRIMGRSVPVGEGPGHAGDVLLSGGFFPDAFAANPEACSIHVFEDHAALAGRSPEGVARAAARFLQVLTLTEDGEQWFVPAMHMQDMPSQGLSLIHI